MWGNPFSARFAPDPRASRITTTETRERRSWRGWKASASRAPELSMHSIMVMRPSASLENYVDVIPHISPFRAVITITTVPSPLSSLTLWPPATRGRKRFALFSPRVFLSRIHKIQLSLSRLTPYLFIHHLSIILLLLSSFHPRRSTSFAYQRLLDRIWPTTPYYLDSSSCSL